MTHEVPKAILYSWHESVWSTVPRLCLFEKGYSDEEYSVKQVDITKGENFAPAYLKINMNGTVPTMVVPTIETTSAEVATKFRSLRDTITICDFLDKARGSHTSHTVSDRPAPALAPATIEGKALSDSIINLVHLPNVDPNFLLLTSRSADELKAKANSKPGKMLDDRRTALKHYIEEAKKLAAEASGNNAPASFEEQIVVFLEEKAAANEVLWRLFHGDAGEEAQTAFIGTCKKAWEEGVPEVLAKLEEEMKGPYVLGDQVSLADLHVIAWLARLVSICEGSQNSTGLDTLQYNLGGKTVGTKVRAFWDAWIQRDSFKKAYHGGLH